MSDIDDVKREMTAAAALEGVQFLDFANAQRAIQMVDAFFTAARDVYREDAEARVSAAVKAEQSRAERFKALLEEAATHVGPILAGKIDSVLAMDSAARAEKDKTSEQ